MPTGVPYIIANEAAERFSFYGMKAILVVFMTKYLMGRDGELATMGDAEATSWYHLFTSGVYFTPIFGALIADIFFGKYRTIIALSIVYVLGHLALAMDETRLGLAIGLTLIAIGSGGIKPCVSAHVGDQFGGSNQHLLTKVFAWFYFSINFGAAASSLLIPAMLDRYGPNVAFGIPGLLMLIATIAFWMGRREFVHIPPGGRRFVRETFSREGLLAAAKLGVVFAFVAMFWALFDQTGSTWVLQADRMDRTILGYEILPAQIQAANPIMIMILIPIFAYGIYPAINKVYRLTPMRKIAIGMFIAAAAFAISALIESWIVAGQTPHIGWQILAYLVITAAEVMISITCLEFAYTQAPRTMKSFIMSLYLLSVSLGNLFTAGVNLVIQNPDGSSKLTGPAYFLFFTGAMAATGVLFAVYARFYKERTHIQGEDGAPAPETLPAPKEPSSTLTGMSDNP
jgi:proton-dependent oligopeptide transporter, POT family